MKNRTGFGLVLFLYKVEYTEAQCVLSIQTNKMKQIVTMMIVLSTLIPYASGAVNKLKQDKVPAHKQTLVSNRTLDWGTYFAGPSDQHVTCIANGDSGCVYIAGYTTSTSGIATAGAYSTLFGGKDDVFLAKFDSTGHLHWATYYGGEGSDEAYGLVYDGNGNIYLSGLTSSTSGIATAGSYQSSYAGGGDAFLAKFSSAGDLVWGTYYGGSDVDYTTGMCVDVSGHIYITGRTHSVDSIATPGAFETTSGDTVNTSGFIAKFNDSGAIIWATYYGGDDDVEPRGICSDDSGYIYMAGTTGSDVGIATPGAFLDSLDSISDDAGFIVKFSSQGIRKWGTYFGSGGSNILEGVTCDKTGNVLVTGSTYCTGHIATPGSFKSTLSGTANAYLTKFNSAGAILWGTYYGNAGDGSNALALDTAGNIYITGSTTSVTSIATTGAYQTDYAGEQDAFIAEFTPSGSLEWGSYYGGLDYDEAFGVVCDKTGYVYITGSSKSASGITSAGAFDTVFTAAVSGDDVFLARFGPVATNHTSVNQLNENEPEFIIFPDPAKDVLHISTRYLLQTVMKLNVFNMAGQLVMNLSISGNPIDYIIPLDNLEGGEYIIGMQYEGKNILNKFTVVR